MRSAQAVLIALMLGFTGCGQAAPDPRDAAAALPSTAATAERDAASSSGENEGSATTSAGLHPKIIYTAHVELVARDFDGVPQQITRLVKDHGGYVAEAALEGQSGGSRAGRWRIRVPVDRFESFVAAAERLGELERSATESQDVTMEYVDVEARIRNKSRQEARLIELLGSHAGNLEDLLGLERELARVREEIERLEGRMRVLRDQTTYSTVHLVIRERQVYQPPQAPGYFTRLLRAFVDSASWLASLVGWLVLTLVAAIPWLAALLLLGGLGHYAWRALR